MHRCSIIFSNLGVKISKVLKKLVVCMFSGVNGSSSWFGDFDKGSKWMMLHKHLSYYLEMENTVSTRQTYSRDREHSEKDSEKQRETT